MKSAVKLLQMVNNIEDQEDSAMMSDIIKVIKVFGHIANLLLTIFCDTKINLIEQLVNLSKLSFILIVIFRKHGRAFMTKMLYLDIQSTIQDSYIIAAWFKKKAQSDTDLLLFQLGTDQLENYI